MPYMHLENLSDKTGIEKKSKQCLFVLGSAAHILKLEQKANMLLVETVLEISLTWH